MTRDAFVMVAGNLALDLVNTVGYRGRGRDARDDLSEPAALDRWLAQAGLPARRKSTDGDLADARRFREEIHRIFRPGARPGLRALNARLAEVAGQRQLERKAGAVVWSRGAALGPVVLAAAELLVSGAAVRVRECEGEGCGWLFLDHSPAQRRRWCRMSDCGNRAKARRHYDRLRR